MLKDLVSSKRISLSVGNSHCCFKSVETVNISGTYFCSCRRFSPRGAARADAGRDPADSARPSPEPHVSGDRPPLDAHRDAQKTKFLLGKPSFDQTQGELALTFCEVRGTPAGLGWAGGSGCPLAHRAAARGSRPSSVQRAGSRVVGSERGIPLKVPERQAGPWLVGAVNT